MHKKFHFQTSFKLIIIAAILVTIFGLFAFTPTMAENSNIKLSDIQVNERDLYRVPIDGSTPLNAPLAIGVNTGNAFPTVQISPNRDRPPLVDNSF